MPFLCFLYTFHQVLYLLYCLSVLKFLYFLSSSLIFHSVFFHFFCSWSFLCFLYTFHRVVYLLYCLSVFQVPLFSYFIFHFLLSFLSFLVLFLSFLCFLSFIFHSSFLSFLLFFVLSVLILHLPPNQHLLPSPSFFYLFFPFLSFCLHSFI